MSFGILNLLIKLSLKHPIRSESHTARFHLNQMLSISCFTAIHPPNNSRGQQEKHSHPHCNGNQLRSREWRRSSRGGRRALASIHSSGGEDWGCGARDGRRSSRHRGTCNITQMITIIRQDKEVMSHKGGPNNTKQSSIFWNGVVQIPAMEVVS